MSCTNIKTCCCCSDDCDLKELLEDKEGEAKQIIINNLVHCCCCCKDGEKPGPDPEPEPEPEPEPDPDDPNFPGLPLLGEPSNLYVTYRVNTPQNIPLVNQRIMRWDVPDDYIPESGYGAHVATAEADNAQTKTSRTKEGITASEWIYILNRIQYVTGYELGTDAANSKYMPKNWKLYLSSDGGDTWILKDQRQYLWERRDRQHWDIKPGFYNAYKLEVKDVCGGNFIALKNFRLIGLPTEVIPAQLSLSYWDEKDISYAVGHVVEVAGHQGDFKLAAGEYMEHKFRSRRKVRSCTVCFRGTLPKGFDLLGSDDGITWDTLLSVRNANFVSLEDAYFDLDKVGFYYRYRMKPTSATSVAYYQLYRTGASKDQTLPVVAEEEYDEYDPYDLGDPNLPGLPLKGEGRYLVASPQITPLPGAESRNYLKANYLNLYALDNSDVYTTTNLYANYWKTNAGVKTNTITGEFKRYQYITGYEIKIRVKGVDAPKEWELYLTQDGGITWTLAHTVTYNWGKDSELTGFDLPPGFYNGYRLRIVSVHGGNSIELMALRMLGVPTEVLPCSLLLAEHILPVSENCFFSSKNISGTPATAAYLTNFDYSKITTILPDGYVDFEFIDKRKVRSFSMMLSDSSLMGWDILGSNDGTTWDVVFSTSGQDLEAKEQYDYTLDKVAFYRRYRLVATQCRAATGANIIHFQMYR